MESRQTRNRAHIPEAILGLGGRVTLIPQARNSSAYRYFQKTPALGGSCLSCTSRQISCIDKAVVPTGREELATRGGSPTPKTFREGLDASGSEGGKLRSNGVALPHPGEDSTPCVCGSSQVDNGTRRSPVTLCTKEGVVYKRLGQKPEDGFGA